MSFISDTKSEPSEKKFPFNLRSSLKVQVKVFLSGKSRVNLANLWWSTISNACNSNFVLEPYNMFGHAEIKVSWITFVKVKLFNPTKLLLGLIIFRWDSYNMKMAYARCLLISLISVNLLKECPVCFRTISFLLKFTLKASFQTSN